MSIAGSAPYDVAWGSSWNWKQDLDTDLQAIHSQLQAYNRGNVDGFTHTSHFPQHVQEPRAQTSTAEFQNGLQGEKMNFGQLGAHDLALNPRPCDVVVCKPHPSPSTSSSLIAWATAPRSPRISSVPLNPSSEQLPPHTNDDPPKRRIIEIPVETIVEGGNTSDFVAIHTQETESTCTSSGATDLAMERLLVENSEIDVASEYGDFLEMDLTSVSNAAMERLQAPKRESKEAGESADVGLEKSCSDKIHITEIVAIPKRDSDGCIASLVSERELDTLSLSIGSSEALQMPGDTCQDDRYECSDTSGLADYHWQMLYDRQLETLSVKAQHWLLRAVLIGWASAIHLVLALRRLRAWLQKGVAARSRKMLYLWHSVVHAPFREPCYTASRQPCLKPRHSCDLRVLSRMAQRSFLPLFLQSWHAIARQVSRHVQLISLETSATRMKLEHRAALHMLAATRTADRAADLQSEILHAWFSIVCREVGRSHTVDAGHTCPTIDPQRFPNNKVADSIDSSPKHVDCLHQEQLGGNDLSPLARSTIVLATSASMAAAVTAAAKRIVGIETSGSLHPH